MTKLITFFIYLFICQISISQISGEIEYDYINHFVKEDDTGKQRELNDFLRNLDKHSKDFSFILLFKNHESIFGIEKQMESDRNSLTLSYLNNIVSKGKYYFNNKKKLLLRESNIYDSYTLIKSTPNSEDWTLTKETKQIGDYLCYKAIKIKRKVNNSGEHSFEVEAWYSPEIPVPFGPNEFNGLPGLILELRDSHYTFYIKKITLGGNDIEIKALESKIILTEEEHEKHLKRMYSNLRNN